MGMVAGATTENGAAWPAAAALVSMRCFARRSIGDAKHSSAGGGEEEKRKSAYFGNSFSGNHDTCMIGPAVVLTAIEQTAAVAQSEFEITSCPAALRLHSQARLPFRSLFQVRARSHVSAV